MNHVLRVEHSNRTDKNDFWAGCAKSPKDANIASTACKPFQLCMLPSLCCPLQLTSTVFSLAVYRWLHVVSVPFYKTSSAVVNLDVALLQKVLVRLFA